MSVWRPGIITARCTDGDKSLPGWINEPFGLDWGIHKDTGEVMWVVHHLPTGWNVAAVNHEIDQVMQFVDLLRSLGDWSFSDPSGIDAMRDAIQIARASDFDVCNPSRVGRPTYPDQMTVAA